MIIEIKTLPLSKEQKIIKEKDNIFKVFLKSAAKEGKANKELLTLLSGYFKLSKNNIKIKVGYKNKLKIIEINKNAS